MKTAEFIKIRESLKKELDEKRYEHTLGVSFTAAAMAMKYGVPIKSAQLAGLLHDCAKCLTGKQKLSICKKNDIPVSEFENNNPDMLHGKVGAFIAATQYGVEDEDILNAITYHTTGRPGMSKLEKIIYIADYIEPGRKPLPDLDAIRNEAFSDLDGCLIHLLRSSLDYLHESGRPIDDMTEKTYKYYIEENI
ncbi:MAG: bis(5'-nucleosyl)-tetraphosphatase (symmetrical) YqeK [Acetatifactor sp.]|nr:bis(5'-nucleosyl)-tetraphosphatase (symmetrical) YqeK [Acetatifactor sp.]